MGTAAAKVAKAIAATAILENIFDRDRWMGWVKTKVGLEIWKITRGSWKTEDKMEWEAQTL